jgi:uncharacterized membrane protein YphA (DoxX/SURF4 family)
MSLLQRIEQWGNKHHPKWVDIIRIALGLFLCFKGIDFLQNMSVLLGILSSKASFGGFSLIIIGHYVVFAHILGGILIATGFFTRFACLVQIPILLVAVFFVNLRDGMMRPYSELFLSILVLLLLVYFLIIGNGSWAVKLKEEEKK